MKKKTDADFVIRFWKITPHFKMGHLLFTSLFLLWSISSINGQQCNANLASECYYTGAATISAGANAQSHKYFAIGGLFDIHERNGNDFCSSDLSVTGMTYLMAFFWSIREFSSIFQPGQMNVGAIAFDSCMRYDQTIENVLSFSSCKVRVQGINQENVVAYIGPYSNKDALRTTMLAADLKLTLLSPEANSIEFNDGNDYKNLLRLSPNIKYDFKAIKAFLVEQNSELVTVVYSEDSEMEYKEFMTVMNNDKCHDGIKMENDITEVATSVVKNKGSKFVISLLSKEMTKQLMQQTQGNSLIYILDSDIGHDKDFVQEDAIIVEPVESASFKDDLNKFNIFLQSVNTNATLNGNIDGVVNPFLSAWIQQNKKFPNLNSDDPRTSSYNPSTIKMNVMRTIQAIKIVIDGFDRAVRAKCNIGINNYQFCDDLRNQEDKLYSDIKGSMFGDNGDVVPNDVTYHYYRYDRRNNLDSKYTMIGTYKESDGTVTKVTQAAAGDNWSNIDSVCPTDNQCCNPTTQPPPTTNPPATQPQMQQTTESNSFVPVMYPKGKEITGAFSDQDRPSEEYGTRFDLNQKWIIALGVLAGLGVVCVVVFEIYILYKMVGKKVDNKWRTMWLGQLLLFGIFLSYLTCFAFLFIPTEETCGITRFGVGVSYAICFAVLLVKLMVILTSKTSEVLLPGDVDSPNYLKGVYQFLMFVFAVGVQVVINIQWLITVPPEAIKVIAYSGKEVWVCNHYTWETGINMLDMSNFVRTNFENHVLSLTYIMIMILIITILSLKAHGIITNHRESVFIGIAAGFSIPIWLAWCLVGGLNLENDDGHEYGDACIAFGLLLTATLMLFSMFLPKVRQLVNMGVEGIYLEDDRDTIYGGSIIMAPPSYKSKGPSSVIYVNNQGIYSEPVVIGNGDTLATHLKHPLSTYSAPPTYLKKTESTYGGSRVLRVTDDLKGRHPNSRSTKKPLSEVNFGNSARPRSLKGTLPRSRSQSDLGAL